MTILTFRCARVFVRVSFLEKFNIPLRAFIITLSKSKNLKCYEMYEYVILLKPDSAIDILQETFHVLNKK